MFLGSLLDPAVSCLFRGSREYLTKLGSTTKKHTQEDKHLNKPGNKMQKRQLQNKTTAIKINRSFIASTFDQ